MAVKMSNARLHCLLAGFILLFAAFQYQVLAQSTDCPPAATLLSNTDPAYADAKDLAHNLENHGFVVQCMFPTKLGSIFEVADGNALRSTVEGEANFHTNYGDFDVVFVPKPQTFANFKITEHREGGGYLYRFFGTPRVWATNRYGTASRQHFLKHDNQLLIVVNEQLRARLEQALNIPRQAH
jgi:hypothetical protein